MKGHLVLLSVAAIVGANAPAYAQTELVPDHANSFETAPLSEALDRPSFQTEFLSWETTNGFGLGDSISLREMPLKRGETSQTSFSFRIDRIDQRNGQQRRGWYVFAGSDDEALTLSGLTGADLQLRDHVTIGDVHVGLSFPAGIGQAAFGYSRRSVEYETKSLSATIDEDILGLSYGLRF